MLNQLIQAATPVAYPVIPPGGTFEIEASHFTDTSNSRTLALYACLASALPADVDFQLVAYKMAPPAAGDFVDTSTDLAITPLASVGGNLLFGTPVTIAVPGVRVMMRFKERGGNGTLPGTLMIAGGVVQLPT